MNKFELEAYAAPKEVATKATFLKKGRKLVMTASGGVQVHPWLVADSIVETDELNPVREEASAKATKNWWWQ